MNVLSSILSHKQQHRPLLAILIDPDKQDKCVPLLPSLKYADLIFIGGSTATHIEHSIHLIRQHTNSPLVLFPGNVSQISPEADALLFLSLLNAQQAEWLITPHIAVAQQVLQSKIETIPMGYILIEGGRKSSVETVSKCQPIPQHAINQILSTAIAGQLLGKQLIYLEAGSGAHNPISTKIIRTVHEHIQVPLIVGGGICTPDAMIQAFEAGADIVVIGNHFEQYPEELPLFFNALSLYETTHS